MSGQSVVGNGLRALFISAVFITGPAVHGLQAAEKTEKPSKASPAQIQELKDALVEGLSEKDWKLVTLSIKGLKAGGVKGAVLEQTLREARSQAALALLGTQTRARLEIWDLGAQALTGNAKALALLKAYSETELVKDPDPAKIGDYQAYSLKLFRSVEALEPLANLKAPEVSSVIQAWLKDIPSDRFNLGQGSPEKRKLTTLHYQIKSQRMRLIPKLIGITSGDEALVKMLSDKTLPIETRTSLWNAALSNARIEGKESPTFAKLKKMFLSLLVDFTGKENRTTINNLMSQTYFLDLGEEELNQILAFQEKVEDKNVKRMVSNYIKSAQRRRNTPVAQKGQTNRSTKNGQTKKPAPNKPVEPPKEQDF